MAILPDNYLTDVRKKGYEIQIERKTPQEAAKARKTRLNGYFSICVSGLTTLYWSGAASMLKDTHESHPNLAYIGVIYSLCVLLLTLAGVVAASFPTTTPWYMGIAGLGSWQAMISVLVTFHMSTFGVHPNLLHNLISMSISILVVSIFWGLVAQDPDVLHVTAKYVVWACCQVFEWIIRGLAHVCDGVDFSPVTHRVDAVCNAVRAYLAYSPSILPAEFGVDIAVKNYTKNKSAAEVEEEEDTRLGAYLTICRSGVTTLYWSGAATNLLELHKTHSTEAYFFVLYSLFSITMMLLAVTVATFPSSACCKMECSGFGALQAMLFVVSTFHVATFKLHKQSTYFWISLSVTSALLTVFWGISSQDPIIIHVAAKCVVWCLCWIGYAIYLFGCWVVSVFKKAANGATSLKVYLFAANPGVNEPNLQGPLLPLHNHAL